MKPTYDALIDEVMLHEHSEKLNLTGGTLTGDLNFPVTGYVMRDSNGVRWRVTVGTDGALTTTAIVSTGEIGTPWLFLFGAI